MTGFAMETSMLRFRRGQAWIVAACTALAFGAPMVHAQTAYPNRPVKIIVPIGAGGAWDLSDDKLDGFVASEYENWTKLIREAGIKLD
jgi:tripartite-type tricarboxylate transporter receptor subunit TctC